MTNENKEQILEALYLATPYVEDTAASGDNYKDSHILNVLRKMHLVIALLEESNEGKN